MNRLVIAVLVLGFVACASTRAKKDDGTPALGKVEKKVLAQAAFELQCDATRLTITKLSVDAKFMGVENATYGVTGCDRQATYKTSCGNGMCSVFNMAQMPVVPGR